MVASGIARTVTRAIRFFQLLFAVVLVGALSYKVDQFRDFGFGGVPREVITREVFSVLAIPFTTFAILAFLFLDGASQIIATFFEFVLFVEYVTSASLLRPNFHRYSREDPLRDALINIRTAHGINGREDRNGGLVRLVVGILFFITTILSLLVVHRSNATSDNSPVSEKHSCFSFSRGFRGSGEDRAVPSSAV